MEKRTEVREDGRKEVEVETRPPNVVILIKRKRGDNMSRIKRYPAFWLKRHRTGNIRDHPQRYHINVGKRYSVGQYRRGDIRKDYHGGSIHISDDEYSTLIESFDDEEFVDVFYDGDPEELVRDNPFIYDKLKKLFRKEILYPDAVRRWLGVKQLTREDYIRFVDESDDTLFFSVFYNDDYQEVLNDNPFIIEKLKKHFSKNIIYKELVERWLRENPEEVSRFITFEDQDEIRKNITGHYRIKGWKKIKDTDRVFRYKCDARNEYVFGGKYHDKQLWEVRYKGGERHFKTKSEALKFAKEWMKKHPNGV